MLGIDEEQQIPMTTDSHDNVRRKLIPLCGRHEGGREERAVLCVRPSGVIKARLLAGVPVQHSWVLAFPPLHLGCSEQGTEDEGRGDRPRWERSERQQRGWREDLDIGGERVEMDRRGEATRGGTRPGERLGGGQEMEMENRARGASRFMMQHNASVLLRGVQGKVLLKSLLQSQGVDPRVPIEDGKDGETARRRRSQASMLSPSQCVAESVEVRAQSARHDSMSRGEALHSIHVHPCVFMWELLYLDVRPLGLQALHARQNLLLVPGKSHTHLSQFTTRKIEQEY
ncbi:hypothetical protein EYF80_011682 [Liparis tanakae]|uniref:Uncharacterized protein n=1 Tax=Liparis tanakae TaxID=230148 RepID=A0A4Z2IK56_9TELE|nr:hypothetical protein EYF80_011682 [Liparis tanakae]